MNKEADGTIHATKNVRGKEFWYDPTSYPVFMQRPKNGAPLL